MEVFRRATEVYMRAPDIEELSNSDNNPVSDPESDAV